MSARLCLNGCDIKGRDVNTDNSLTPANRRIGPLSMNPGGNLVAHTFQLENHCLTFKNAKVDWLGYFPSLEINFFNMLVPVSSITLSS